MRTFLKFLLCFTAISQSIFCQTGESPIDIRVLPIIVKLSSPSARLGGVPITGSGFTVSLPITDEQDTVRAIFLVTNKHMVSDWSLADSIINRFNEYVDVNFYRRVQGNLGPSKALRIHLYDENGHLKNDLIQAHPNPNIDICLILLDSSSINDQDIYIPSFDETYFLPFDSISSWGFNIGSQVFVLGYPLGITSLTSSYPIAKSGLLASIPGELFSIQISDTTMTGQLVNKVLRGKLLIVDGLIVKGNSGGPVIIPSIIRTRIDTVKNQWQHWNKASANLVIGVLAGSFGPSGLSYVFSSDYIFEAVAEFCSIRGFFRVQ